MTCTKCGKRAYSEYCVQHKPRKPIITKKRPAPRGKESFKWQEIRADWIDRHPAPWRCYLCGIPLDMDTLTLDHVIPKSNFRNYAQRHDDANLKPCCAACNSAKGSKHLANHQDI